MKSPKSQKNNHVSILVGIFLAVMACVLYVNLGRDTLFDWDEGIYGTLGAEVISSKNLFVTTWNGAPWFEKPPGIAWISAAGQSLAGHSALGARLFQPAVAVAVLYVLYLLGTALFTWRVGLIAMGVMATFDLFLGRTRAVNADMPLLLGIITAVYFLGRNKKPVYVALVIALSVWFKGIAGLLPVLLAVPLILTKPKKYMLSVIAYSLLFILPWHVFAYFAYGNEFLTPYFREQVMTRIQVPIEFHTESRWFYFDYIYKDLGLGVLLVAGFGAAALLFDTYRKKKIEGAVVVWWALLPFAIFTVAKTRLFWYILPVYPAISLLLGFAIYRVASGKKALQIVAVIAVLICVQGVKAAWQSVEPAKKVATVPERIELVSKLSSYNSYELAVLVPENERLAEAILPVSQRISSSFRYGGNPSLVFYYGGHIRYFYNLDEFRDYWNTGDSRLALLDSRDLKHFDINNHIIDRLGNAVAVWKGLYAQR